MGEGLRSLCIILFIGLQTFGAYLYLDKHPSVEIGNGWKKETAFGQTFSYPAGKFSMSVMWDSKNDEVTGAWHGQFNADVSSSSNKFPCDLQIKINGIGEKDGRPVCSATPMRYNSANEAVIAWFGQSFDWSAEASGPFDHLNRRDELWLSIRHISPTSANTCPAHIYAVHIVCHVPVLP